MVNVKKTNSTLHKLQRQLRACRVVSFTFEAGAGIFYINLEIHPTVAVKPKMGGIWDNNTHKVRILTKNTG